MKKVKIKQWVCLLAVLYCSTGVMAQQYKVIQKSDKKVPQWYESAGSGYLVASAEEEDMETARQKCLESIRIQMIQAVAQNVEFEETTLLKQTTRDQNEILEFVNAYTAEGSARAASVPFLKGISLSKVEASYWEKREYKTTKKITYAYAIRYPLSKIELYNLTQAFEEQDRSMVARLDQLEQHLNEVSSVEDIEQSMNQLRPVADYFFDRVRKERANSLLASYQKLPSYIAVEGVEGTGNSYRVWLTLQGRKITSSSLPAMKSNCASQLKASAHEDEFVITYTNEDCLEDEENTIDVLFRVQGRTLKHTFFIPGSPQY
ncbi:MAG: hypothetical protein LUG98_01345 [Tannerellaceae bacterium]|nr:hypothetical protein [Tannerellaceae bacterium]